MDVTVNLSSIPVKDKPDAIIYSKIYDSFKVRTFSIDLVDKVFRKLTVRPNLGGGKTSEAGGQQLLMVDIDDGLTIDEFEEKYSHLNHFLIYTTLSHTQENHRFRVAYNIGYVIEDPQVVEKLVLALMDIVSECDHSCKRLNRMFLPGQEVIYFEKDRLVDVSLLLKHYEQLDFKKKEICNNKKREKKICLPVSNFNKNIEYISALDFHGLRQVIKDYSDSELFKTNDDLFVEFFNFKTIFYSYSSNYVEDKVLSTIMNGDRQACIYNELVDWFINCIRLPTILGTGQYGLQKCIFHNDRSPSASIIVTKSNADYYKCFAGCLDRKGYLLSIVKELSGCGHKEARDFILRVFNLYN